MTEAPKPLRAFYGASDRLKANTAKAHIGSGSARPQEIYTPPCIVDALGILWPEGVALDPCSGPGSIIGAQEAWQGEHWQVQDKNGRPKVNGKGEQVMEWIGPGLTGRWRPRTFLNPTYENLKEWLQKALADGIEDSRGELVFLIPWRSSRTWFREYLKYTTQFCLLDPLTFQGFDQAFPAPLVLTYHGDRDLEKATQGLGEVFCVT